MFFNLQMLCRRGCFYIEWRAATIGLRSVKNSLIEQVNVCAQCDLILTYVTSDSNRRSQRFSLVLSSKLLNGLVKIHRRQAEILIDRLADFLKPLSGPLSAGHVSESKEDEKQPKRKTRKSRVPAAPIPKIPETTEQPEPPEVARPPNSITLVEVPPIQRLEAEVDLGRGDEFIALLNMNGDEQFTSIVEPVVKIPEYDSRKRRPEYTEEEQRPSKISRIEELVVVEPPPEPVQTETVDFVRPQSKLAIKKPRKPSTPKLSAILYIQLRRKPRIINISNEENTYLKPTEAVLYLTELAVNLLLKQDHFRLIPDVMRYSVADVSSAIERRIHPSERTNTPEPQETFRTPSISRERRAGKTSSLVPISEQPEPELPRPIDQITPENEVGLPFRPVDHTSPEKETEAHSKRMESIMILIRSLTAEGKKITLEDVAQKPFTKKTMSNAFFSVLELSAMGYISPIPVEGRTELDEIKLR